jgi:uncharacterized protein (DUF433 family)
MTDRITIDPNLCHGKPCIRGLRYPVENVLEWLAGGMSIDETLAFAARMAHTRRIKPLAVASSA